MDSHCKVLHSETSQTLAKLRQEYWVPHGRTVIVIKDCRVCRRAEAAPFTMLKMPSLPIESVARSRPFEYTGIDYFGPMSVKVFLKQITNQQSRLKERYGSVCLLALLELSTLSWWRTCRQRNFFSVSVVLLPE